MKAKAWQLPLAVMLLILLVGGFGMYLYGVTIVKWWLPLAIGIGMAGLLWFGMRSLWERVMPCVGIVKRLAVHFVAGTVLFSTAVLAANRYGVVFRAGEEMTVKVADRHEEHRRHYARHGRGREYTTYILVLRFPDGREKKIEVTRTTYNHTPLNREIKVEVTKGLFSWLVITSMDL